MIESPETTLTGNQLQQRAPAGRVKTAVRTLEAHRDLLTVEEIRRLGEVIRYAARSV